MLLRAFVARVKFREAGYVVFPDEGHRRDYGNWRNVIRHYTEIERFLAGCLGGRRSAS